MTEPSQYFKGRTVQEQMNEVIGYVDTRAAEVATDAIAADVAQVHQDMLDADADASAAAASAAAAAGTLANAVKKTGESSQSIAGDVAVAGDLTGGTVTVPTPVNNNDAANKKYVDDADARLIPINNVNAYALGLSGNQTKTGVLTLNPIANSPIILKKTTDERDVTPSNNLYTNINITDNNDVTTFSISKGHYTNGHVEAILFLSGEGNKNIQLQMRVRPDGTGYVRIQHPDGTTTNLDTW